jgi:monomeric sarcosine oxidase
LKTTRRELLKTAGAGALTASLIRPSEAAGEAPTVRTGKTYEVVVVGSGVFGAWTAYWLRKKGLKVALVDEYGAASSRGSSGGQTRIIRMSYGDIETYTRWSMRSLGLWQSFFAEVGRPELFHPTGVLWMARSEDSLSVNSLAMLRRVGVHHEKVERAELERRWPQIAFGPITWAIWEPESGTLMAYKAVQAVADKAAQDGVETLPEAVLPPAPGKGRLSAVATKSGKTISAEKFVFACGPWLPKVFPDVLGDRIFPTRQPVFYFGPTPGDTRFAPPAMPVWIDLGDEIYGLPDVENRGFKVALDHHGPAFDPDTGVRMTTPDDLARVRDFVSRRFPALKDSPVVGSEVCQYENTSNGDFLIDKHPERDNVWLVGGGSGHGFKHGPALGEYVTARVVEGGAVEPRFSLATKEKIQNRNVY